LRRSVCAFSAWFKENASQCLSHNKTIHYTAKKPAQQQAGDIRVVMITGDSPQCGVHIARECGLTGQTTPIYLGEFDSKQGTVVWHEMSADEEGRETNLTTDELLTKVSSAVCVALALESVAYL